MKIVVFFSVAIGTPKSIAPCSNAPNQDVARLVRFTHFSYFAEYAKEISRRVDPRSYLRPESVDIIAWWRTSLRDSPRCAERFLGISDGDFVGETVSYALRWRDRDNGAAKKRLASILGFARNMTGLCSEDILGRL